MQANNTGFSISKCADETEFNRTKNVLEIFSNAFDHTTARKKSLKTISADGTITSLEITRDFLDLNGDGLDTGDFYGKESCVQSTQKQLGALSSSFTDLETLFSTHGINLRSRIWNYSDYYRETEWIPSDDTYSPPRYIEAPAVFSTDRQFVLNCIQAAKNNNPLANGFIRSAYSYASPDLKTDLNFNRQAVAIDIAVVFSVHEKVRKILFSEDPSLLVQAIAENPAYYRYTSKAQRENPEFLKDVVAANKDVLEKLSKESKFIWKTAVHQNF